MPNTIAENLSRLVTAKTAIADSITTMGGTVNTGDGFEEFPADILTIPSGGGGGGSSSDTVNFYDYDGTIVQSYSADVFANLSAMPANPTHEGLTAQGWNWSLADAKAHVAKYGSLNIGQMYITSDGKTRLYFIASENAHVELYLTLGADTELDIDWGDGSEHTRWTSNDGDDPKSHDYTSAGRYVISIEVVTGELYLTSSAYDTYKIEIGNSVTSIGDYAFYERYTLSSITIPDSVTSIDEYAFASCYALSSITIPDSVTSIGGYAFNSCYALSSITIPDSVTSIGNGAFTDCHALTSITIPDSVTSIGSAFSSSYVSSITIPDGVTSIDDNAFSGCPVLSSITISDSVTSISYQAFYECHALSSITIPDSVTSIGDGAFTNCYALSSITIPDSVTSIGNGAFTDCHALTSITIPDSVTSISSDAFANCYALSLITFESSTPPDLYGSLGMPNTCIIRVPQGSLSAYTSADYYPDPSEYIYVEY